MFSMVVSVCELFYCFSCILHLFREENVFLNQLKYRFRCLVIMSSQSVITFVLTGDVSFLRRHNSIQPSFQQIGLKSTLSQIHVSNT